MQATLKATEGIAAAMLISADYVEAELARYTIERTTLNSSLTRGWVLA